jgi:hypothetical protein
MSRTLSVMSKQIIGPGHALEDANSTPIVFRETPNPVNGVSLATPVGPATVTGSDARKIPQPE